MRGVVTGTDPGDSVEVWFEGGGQRSDSFTYEAVSESGNRVLVVAAEDYTGASPVQDPAGPHFVTQYTDALAANGQEADVYDIDAAGRIAPDALGVLSHYDAVVWETGNDLVTRTAGRGWRQCRPAGTRRTARVPLVHERGRQGAPRRRLRRPAVHQRRRGQPALRPQGRDRLQPASRGYGPAALPALVRLVLRWRHHQRRAAVLPGWLRCRGQRRSRRRRGVRLDQASTTRSRASRGVSTIPSSRATPSGGRRSSRRAASCRPTSSSSSRAGPRRGTTSRVARSTRTPEPSTSTRRSPTSPTRGSPARSPCRQPVGR